jgi:hypothetical protein
MQWLADGFSYILLMLAKAVDWIGELFVAVFKAAWDFMKDSACWLLEEIMKLVLAAITAIDVSGMQSLGSWWGGIPGDVLNILGLIGFGYAMGIIASAIAIRLVLQLIPFTRLGS